MINDNEPWVAEAVTTDALVADLLLRLKRSSSSSPLHTPPSTPAPPGWGDRKSRSKGHQQKSPTTTLLSWNDGYDDSSTRSSDLYSGNRSLKIGLNEDRRKGWESGSESEMMKRRRRCMLPDLNETPAPAYE